MGKKIILMIAAGLAAFVLVLSASVLTYMLLAGPR